MPTLRIMSIYQENARRFAAEFARLRDERERFMATLVARFGEKTAELIRQDSRWAGETVLGSARLTDLVREISVASMKLYVLHRRIVAVRKKIRTPDCWFRESPGIACVLHSAGLSWRMVHERCSDGSLPVATAMWLLRILRQTEHGIPANEQTPVRAATGIVPCRLSKKWRERLLRRRAPAGTPPPDGGHA